MKGIVFNLLETFVTENWGEDTYWKLLDACQLQSDGNFVGPGTYPDADLFSMVNKASEMLEIPQADALRAFGEFSLPHLMKTAGSLTDGIDNARDLLKKLDSVIHVEVRKMYPGAVTPSFSYTEPSDDELILEYRSKRRLCTFVEGLLAGVAKHYDVKIDVDHKTCTHRGDPHCVFHLQFSKVPATIS